MIAVFVSNRDQRVGDIFAGTVVIRERTDEAPTFDETFSNPIADAAFRRVQKRTEFNADVTVLTAPEIEVVESFLRRRWDLRIASGFGWHGGSLFRLCTNSGPTTILRPFPTRVFWKRFSIDITRVSGFELAFSIHRANILRAVGANHLLSLERPDHLQIVNKNFGNRRSRLYRLALG